MLVRVLDPLVNSARGEKVLLAAPEGERHVVGLRMIADLLDGAGFDVLYLGQDVPCGALRAAVGRHRPAVAGLTCTCSGQTLLRAIGAISHSGSPTRILLGGEGVPGFLRDAGYPWLNRSSGVRALVEEMLERPPEVPPSRFASSRRRTRRGAALTPRQRDVLAGLAHGKSTEQIAAELVVTPVTVRNHVAKILAALGAHSRLEAVATARRLGLVD
jgi:DNA-binding CsgD family transcriptional regulator